jgi:CelD/BcsL family acetyltransferase involved in cellulose biosynthesis
MKVERFTHFDQLCPDDVDKWEQLAADIPFCRSWWLQPWWNAYGQEDNLCLLVAKREASLVGLLPLYYSQSPHGRVLRMLGSGEVCSDYLTLIAEPTQQAEVAEAVADWLSEANNRSDDRWDLLQLENISESDAALQSVVEDCDARECQHHFSAAVDTWRIALPTTWDEYLAMLSKSHRKQVRRIDRNYFESGIATHRICKGSDAIAAFDSFVDLHQQRRKMLGQAGCFHSEAFASFLHDAVIAGATAEPNSVELHFIDVEGAPVSTELHLLGGREHKTAYVYQSGLDPNKLDLEPGRLMHIAVTKRVIEHGFIGLDFLRGDEPYKHHWRAEPLPMVDVRIVPNHLSAKVRHNLWAAGDTVKSWIKTGLTLSGMRS